MARLTRISPNSSAPLRLISGRVLKLVIPQRADSRVAAIFIRAETSQLHYRHTAKPLWS